MYFSRPTALVVGVLFLITEVTAIGGVLLYGPLVTTPDYILSTSDPTRALLGALLEVLLAVAVVGTAVGLYPILKRRSEGLALAFVAARTLEAAMILVGALSLLSVVSLQQAANASTNSATLQLVGEALLALHAWTSLFGPGFGIAIGTLLLAALMYTTRLIPRPIAVLGLLGGTVIAVSSIAVLFGAYPQFSAVGALAGLFVLVWEVSFAIQLIAKGFNPEAFAALDTARVETPTAGPQ